MILLTIFCFCLQMAKPQPFAGATASNLNPCTTMKTASDELPPPRKRINWKDSAGMKFGRLTVLHFAGTNSKGQAIVRCLCDCGTECDRMACSMKGGLVRSCGCLRVERTIERRTSHGHSRNGKVTSILGVYRAMLNRCHGETGHPGYKGRGITVCDRWRFGDGSACGFTCFKNDLGVRPTTDHTIDRKDNDLGYSPENCRWATRVEQANNRRSTVWFEVAGMRKTVLQWARYLGVNRNAFRNSAKKGISAEEYIQARLDEAKEGF